MLNDIIWLLDRQFVQYTLKHYNNKLCVIYWEKSMMFKKKKFVYVFILLGIFSWLSFCSGINYMKSKKMNEHIIPKIKNYQSFQDHYGKITAVKQSLYHSIILFGKSNRCPFDRITYLITTEHDKQYEVTFLFGCEAEDDDIIGYEINGKKVYNEE